MKGEKIHPLQVLFRINSQWNDNLKLQKKSTRVDKPMAQPDIKMTSISS